MNPVIKTPEQRLDPLMVTQNSLTSLLGCCKAIHFLYFYSPYYGHHDIHGHTRAGRPVTTYIDQLYTDTGCLATIMENHVWWCARVK